MMHLGYIRSTRIQPEGKRSAGCRNRADAPSYIAKGQLIQDLVLLARMCSGGGTLEYHDLGIWVP